MRVRLKERAIALVDSSGNKPYRANSANQLKPITFLVSACYRCPLSLLKGVVGQASASGQSMAISQTAGLVPQGRRDVVDLGKTDRFNFTV